jgi:plasmid stabilization system protein ParE
VTFSVELSDKARSDIARLVDFLAARDRRAENGRATAGWTKLDQEAA